MARVPATARVRTLALALVLAALLVGGWELRLRHTGLGAQSGTAVQEAIGRLEQPPAPESRRVLVIGSSRVWHGIDPASAMAGAGPGWDIRNIGVAGASGAGLFHESLGRILPGDIVVVEVLAERFFQDLKSEEQEEFETRMTRIDGYSRIDTAVHSSLRSWFYTARSATSPLNEARIAARGVLDLDQLADDIAFGVEIYRQHDNGWLEHRAVAGASDPPDAQEARGTILSRGQREAARDRVLARLQDDVREAEDRGCKVRFLRMPLSGQWLELERDEFPRAEYWDRLDALFPGQCWNFADDPATRDMPTWDGSHLDSADAKAYSRWLGAKIATEFATDD